MRKPNRAAAVVLAGIIAVPVLTMLHGSAGADPNVNEDRTDSEVYTDARADYWQARADYYARKAATKALKDSGEPIPPADLPPTDGAPDSPAQAVARLSAPTLPTTTTTVAPAPVAAAKEGVPTNSQLAALRMCESTDRYWLSTGNGYYGAYQFSAVTWRWLGYEGWPNDAPPAVQDQAVRDLYAIFGWTPWPACSRALGFR